MTKIKGINQLIDEYSIDELRLLGKNLGVKAPTGMTKEDLAERVLQALKLQQKQKLETRGRPSDQSIAMLERMVASPKNAEENKEEYKPAYDYSSSKIVNYGTMDTSIYSRARLASNVKEYEIVDGEFYIGKNHSDELNKDMEIYNKTGFVDKRFCGWIFRIPNLGIEVPVMDEEILTYGLEQYDTVEFSALFSAQSNRYILLEIHSVNGVKVEKTAPKENFEDLKISLPTEKFEFSGKSRTLALINSVSDITKGGRVLFCTENNDFTLRATDEIMEEIKSQNLPIFALMVDKIKEAEIILTQDSEYVTVISPSDNPETKCEKLLSTIFRARKFVERGQDVVIIINDFDGIDDILTSLITDKNANYICSMALKFFNLGGSYSNGGNLTIFGFVGTQNLKLIERLRRSSTVFVPASKDGEIKPHLVQTQLQEFYMDEEALSVASDIKRILESLGGPKYKEAEEKIVSLAGASREELKKALYNL